MAAQSPGPDAAPFVPNEVFRRIRKLYLASVLGAMPLLFAALLIATSKSSFAIFALLFFAAGIGLLVYALIVRAAAKCPRCVQSLMWRSGPIIGMGRVSLAVKPRCPSCGLDLEQPYDPASAPVSGTPSGSGTPAAT